MCNKLPADIPVVNFYFTTGASGGDCEKNSSFSLETLSKVTTISRTYKKNSATQAAAVTTLTKHDKITTSIHKNLLIAGQKK
jgi:hypothetical protein